MPFLRPRPPLVASGGAVRFLPWERGYPPGLDLEAIERGGKLRGHYRQQFAQHSEDELRSIIRAARELLVERRKRTP